MTEAGGQDNAALIAQLKELNERSQTYSRQFWQVPFAYVVAAGVGLSQIVGKNGNRCALALALAAIAAVGVFTLWHLAGIYSAAYRCFSSLKKVEQKLKLAEDDEPSKWTPTHLWALLLLTASVLVASLIAASCLLCHGACR